MVALQPGMAWGCSLGCIGLQPGLQALSPCGSRLPVGLQPLVCRHAMQLIGCAAASAAAFASAATASAAG